MPDRFRFRLLFLTAPLLDSAEAASPLVCQKQDRASEHFPPKKNSSARSRDKIQEQHTGCSLPGVCVQVPVVAYRQNGEKLVSIYESLICNEFLEDFAPNPEYPALFPQESFNRAGQAPDRPL